MGTSCCCVLLLLLRCRLRRIPVVNGLPCGCITRLLVAALPAASSAMPPIILCRKLEFVLFLPVLPRSAGASLAYSAAAKQQPHKMIKSLFLHFDLHKTSMLLGMR